MDEIYWSNTDDDIQAKIELKYGFEKAKSTESLQSLIFVASAVFGGGKKQDVRPPSSGAEAEAMFNNMFGIKEKPAPSNDPFAGLDGAFEKLK